MHDLVMLKEHYERDNGRIFRSLCVSNSIFSTHIEDRSDGRITADKGWWQSFLRGASTEVLGDVRAPLRVVDIFSGCGGLTLGLREAARAFGFDTTVVAAVDVDGPALQVYAHNLNPNFVINQDASLLVDFMVLGTGPQARFAYRPEIVEERLADEIGKIDVLIAGPPCQGHSNLNNRTRRDDPRNILYVTTVAIAVALGVRAILIENVPEVVRDKNSVVFSAMALLKAAGYTFLDGGILAADKLGGAQTRRRYFLTAVRSDNPEPALTIAGIKSGLHRRPSTVKWAIGDLEKVKANGIMNSVPVMSAENRLRVDYLFDHDVDNLPNHARPDCHKEGTTYTAVYGRMRWDQPAPTITTGFLSPGRGRFVHPRQRRVLTPHEAARIQFFPDSYSFTAASGADPSRNLLGKWIGDAVPPLLGYAAAMHLMSSLGLK